MDLVEPPRPKPKRYAAPASISPAGAKRLRHLDRGAAPQAGNDGGNDGVSTREQIGLRTHQLELLQGLLALLVDQGSCPPHCGGEAGEYEARPAAILQHVQGLACTFGLHLGGSHAAAGFREPGVTGSW